MSDPGRAVGRPAVPPLTVAVTGGIGAGKSTVSRALADRGAVVIDADQLAREVVAKGSPGLAAVTAAFGSSVLSADGSLDRPALGRIVFADPQALRQLEGITHPLVRALTAERLAQVPADGIAVNDIPLIRTTAEAVRYHLVIGVGIADDEVRVQRLVARGHSEQDARARIAAQITDAQRRALADVWVDNSGTEDALKPAVDRLWARLTAFAAHRRAGAVAAREPGNPTGNGLTELDRTGLTTGRVAAACDGRQPVVASNRSGGIAMMVTFEDRAALAAARPRLCNAGFPPIDAPADPQGDSQIELGPCDGDWYGSADPALSLNLYLRVRD